LFLCRSRLPGGTLQSLQFSGTQPRPHHTSVGRASVGALGWSDWCWSARAVCWWGHLFFVCVATKRL